MHGENVGEIFFRGEHFLGAYTIQATPKHFWLRRFLLLNMSQTIY